MLTPTLPEYRCSCGKLFFKGLLFLSLIEIKCNRCGVIHLIREISPNLIGTSALVILINSKGQIVNASNSATDILGYSFKELFGVSIYNLGPAISPSFFEKIWIAGHDSKKSWKATISIRPKNRPVQTTTIQYRFFRQSQEDFMFVIVDTGCSKMVSVQGTPLPPTIYIDKKGVYFEIDLSGKITSGFCRGIEKLDYLHKNIIGISVGKIWPLFKSYRHQLKADQPFEIQDSMLKHKNNNLIAAETYFIPHHEGGHFSGYYVFNWLR